MATTWYVQAAGGERGPMSFQDVAFLLKDQQIAPTSHVRQAEVSDWQPAESVVGLIRASRKHQCLDERIVEDDSSEWLVDQPEADSQIESERDRIMREAHEQLLNDQNDRPIERRNFLEQVMIWGPAGVIAAGLAYSGYTTATYDRFATKNFEAD